MTRTTNAKVDEKLIGRNVQRMGDATKLLDKISWKCTNDNCGNVWITAVNNVINLGTSCPKCARRKSKAESVWLDYHNVPNTPECRQVSKLLPNKQYTVDGYIEETNTVYEFLGDFWHGNPTIYDESKINTVTGKTFGELHRKTILKRQMILNAGYNLVEIWEDDWNKIKSKG